MKLSLFIHLKCEACTSRVVRKEMNPFASIDCFKSMIFGSNQSFMYLMVSQEGFSLKAKVLTEVAITIC